MDAPRARRGLVPFEIAAVLAVAVVPLSVPRALPLVAVASVSVWLRGRAWMHVLRGQAALARIGAAAGAAALVAAVLAGTPAVEALTGRAVVWSQFPVVRGSAIQLVAVAIVVVVEALALELALRGWIVERVLELARPGTAATVLAVAAGALAEALVTAGPVWARLGAAAFGLGLGTLYVAAGRDALPPVCARVVFAAGALVLQWQKLIS